MGDSMDVDQGGGGSAAMDLDEYEEETANLRDESAARYGYGHAHGISRRRSMSHEEEKQRRASIKAILADESITPQERRRSIQNLMDGRRSSIGTASVASSSGESDTNSYGYGDASPYGYGDAGPTPRGDNGYSQSVFSDSSQGAVCVPVCNENTKRAELTRPPCSHYERKCTIISPCCGAAFGCRICHDDSPILPPLLIAKQVARRYARSSSLPGGYTNMDPQTPEDTHHNIDRFKIAEIICRECYTKQSSKT
jgi:hypothetical protein